MINFKWRRSVPVCAVLPVDPASRIQTLISLGKPIQKENQKEKCIYRQTRPRYAGWQILWKQWYSLQLLLNASGVLELPAMGHPLNHTLLLNLFFQGCQESYLISFGASSQILMNWLQAGEYGKHHIKEHFAFVPSSEGNMQKYLLETAPHWKLPVVMTDEEDGKQSSFASMCLLKYAYKVKRVWYLVWQAEAI